MRPLDSFVVGHCPSVAQYRVGPAWRTILYKPCGDRLMPESWTAAKLVSSARRIGDRLIQTRTVSGPGVEPVPSTRYRGCPR
jgi:hypothetical protein